MVVFRVVVKIRYWRGLSSRVTKVGCERFFELLGYVSAPRRTSRLGVCNYERIAMLSSIAQVVYIDLIWVASEYLKRCSKGSWKKENDVDALKGWDLDRIVSAELLNQPQPDEMTMNEFIAECGEED
jgi:hypothetical protein